VGYEERDAIRKDDAWKTFDEIINLGRKEDVGTIAISQPPASGHLLIV
jgi:double-strand break repair protein MRE11